MTQITTVSRALRRLVGGVISLALVALVFVRMAGGNVAVPVAEGPSQLQGLTVRYAMPSGEYVQRTFVSETRALWKVLSGPHEGDTGEESVTVRPIAPGIFFVSRVNALTGETVSEVYNLATLKISIYVTRPDPNDPLRRVETSGDGRLEIVKSSGDSAKVAPLALAP
ncbi:MAG: MoaF-related domain-containing protein [Gammaproteobacteria bacterium]|jgi:hypothetical protein